MKTIILAGGSGTRLWPLSRKKYPKQFLKLNNRDTNSKAAFEKGSLIQQTALRLLKAVTHNDIVIMTNEEYRFHVKADMERVSERISDHIVLEPARRNTMSAIALAVKYCTDQLKCGEDEVIFVSPSDHIIEPENKFINYLRESERIAKDGYIVTFGITPLYPETGYGYINAGKGETEEKYSVDGIDFFRVRSFMEKPDLETAREYINHGGYYWNSGMFAFSIGTFLKEMRHYTPDIMDTYETGYELMLSSFETLPDISIDYAIMEKSEKVVTLPMDIYWNDVGSWDSIYDVFSKDEEGNVTIGDVVTFETRDSLIMSDKRLISTVGLENLLIIETDDAILVSKRGDTQKVKDIVANLKSKKRREASDHTTTYRPWGSYTILDDGERHKIKRILVNKNEKLSLQMHHHRSEHWVVTRGTAKVTIDKETKFIHENESIYIPKSTLHRLENPGRIPLEIIEVQNGEYVDEDDIVRVEDEYGR